MALAQVNFLRSAWSLSRAPQKAVLLTRPTLASFLLRYLLVRGANLFITFLGIPLTSIHVIVRPIENSLKAARVL